MTEDEVDYADWDAWTSHLAGDEAENLAPVFTHVRPDDVGDWRTRAFCELALHLIYKNTIGCATNGAAGCDGGPRLIVRGEDLSSHAAKMLEDPQRAASLSEDRWRQT